MEKSLTRLRATSRFREHLYRKAIALTRGGKEIGATFRLPRLFEKDKAKSFNFGTANEDGYQVDPSRIQPPYYGFGADSMPGFQYDFEQYYRAEGRKLAVYLYVAVEDATKIDQKAFIAQIQERLKKAHPEAPDEWKTVELRTPVQGKKIPWQTNSVTCAQRFLHKDRESKDYEGQLDFYVHSTDRFHILMGWRAPVSIARKIKFFAAAHAAMGTLEIGEPPEPEESEEPSEPGKSEEPSEPGKSEEPSKPGKSEEPFRPEKLPRPGESSESKEAENLERGANGKDSTS